MDDKELPLLEWLNGHPGGETAAPPALPAAVERATGGLAGFLETMPAGFYLLDEHWRIRYVNGAAGRLLGRAPQDIVGTSLWQSFPELSGSVVEEAYRSAVASGRPVTVEAPHPGAPGDWFEVRAWPGPGGLGVYLLDVSDRRRADDAARRAAARATLLARVNAELSNALDTESALARLAQVLVPTLTDACIVTVVDRFGRAIDVGSWHADPAKRPLMAEYAQVRLDAMPSASPVARALDTGTPLTEPVDAVLDLMPPGRPRDLLIALAPASAVALPLTADDRTVGVLTLYQDPGREFVAEDLETASQVAVHAGQAVARVHRQSQQAQLAEALQRSLLTDPPDLGPISVAVRYVPAAEAARVGGDWYDAFLQREGAPVLVIGDVVGHDTAAAAAMGQLRGLLRGIAHYSGAGPAEVLRGLDQAMEDLHTDTLATAAVARLERGDGDRPGQTWGRLRWASAGHPPPILLLPDGTVSVLGGMFGDLMLGVDPAAVRTESVTDLEPGTTVLLYTDGLVERRGSSIDVGMARLAEQLRALAGQPLDRLCDALLEGMLQGTPQDDVALVAVSLGGATDAV